MRWGGVFLILFFCGAAGAMDSRPIKRGPASQQSLPPQPEMQDGTVPVEVTEGVTPSSDTRSSEALPPSEVLSDGQSAVDGVSNWLAMGSYSYVDLWVPGKFGVLVGYALNEKSWVEFDYARANFSTGWVGIDLGRVVEQRAVVQWRYFPNSGRFNYFLGANYNHLEVTLGDSALNTVTALDTSEYELMQLSSLGISAGLGHRWVFGSGFTVAVDWLHVHVPVFGLREDAPFRDATTDPVRRSEADDLIRFVQRFPRIAALKLQLGIRF